MTAMDLINRVAEEVIDTKFKFWSKEYHLSSLNDGLSALIMVRPDLARKITEINLTPGQVRVVLPEQAYKLLSVNHCGGYSLQYIDIDRLNQNYERWRMMEDEQPTNWTRNELDETSFFVFPKPTIPISLEFEYAEKLRITNTDEPVPIPEVYEALLFHYMTYRAYSKEGQQESQQAKAQSHYQAFQMALTGKSESDYQKAARLKASERVLS
ncbi:DUF6682 family protein [Vibrio metschnikovii]|uniref:phage adaptor protein n=1 Tax=Vibrio metschnikovii TaxID=28172 RepID=UPI002FC7EA7C|nr:hypothetical protein [Vibrio metschnikovii]